MDVYDVSQPQSADLVPTATILSELDTLLESLSLTKDNEKSPINQFVEKQLQAKNFIIDALERRTQYATNNIAHSERRTKELEAQRTKLEVDLQGVSGAHLKNQALMDEIPRMPTTAVSEMMIERDKMQMKNLQHRLEQLVAVHRQLLRKYGSLELENTEMRKKLEIREGRIKHLEGNSRGISITLRQQAERHAAELSSLRDQVQVLENEGAKRASPTKPSHVEKGPRTMRGGAGASSAANSSPSGSKDMNDPSTASPKSTGGASPSTAAAVVGSVFSNWLK